MSLRWSLKSFLRYAGRRWKIALLGALVALALTLVWFGAPRVANADGGWLPQGGYQSPCAPTSVNSQYFWSGDRLIVTFLLIGADICAPAYTEVSASLVTSDIVVDGRPVTGTPDPASIYSFGYWGYIQPYPVPPYYKVSVGTPGAHTVIFRLDPEYYSGFEPGSGVGSWVIIGNARGGWSTVIPYKVAHVEGFKIQSGLVLDLRGDMRIKRAGSST